MPEHPSVAAIVINYFGAALTTRCLRSLIGEPLDRIYLIDNSAADGERVALAALAHELNKLDGAIVQLTFNDENLGFAKAVNRAIDADRLATGGHDHYLLMNNDAEATSGLITALLNAATADPAVVLVAPRIRDGEREITQYWYQPYLALVTERRLPGSFPFLSGCCLLVHSSLADGRPLLDEDFFMYGEDVELSARAARGDKHLWRVGDSVVTHASTSSSRKGCAFYEYHVVRGHLLLANKLPSSSIARVLMRGCRALSLTTRAAIRTVRYKTIAPLTALPKAWRDTRN